MSILISSTPKASETKIRSSLMSWSDERRMKRSSRYLGCIKKELTRTPRMSCLYELKVLTRCKTFLMLRKWWIYRKSKLSSFRYKVYSGLWLIRRWKSKLSITLTLSKKLRDEVWKLIKIEWAKRNKCKLYWRVMVVSIKIRVNSKNKSLLYLRKYLVQTRVNSREFTTKRKQGTIYLQSLSQVKGLYSLLTMTNSYYLIQINPMPMMSLVRKHPRRHHMGFIKESSIEEKPKCLGLILLTYLVQWSKSNQTG